MATNWRGLFDDIGVRWVDRGRNARRGNVNIPCPFCTDDPSEHLQVSEDDNGYYCLRAPQQHSGSDLMWLMRTLLPSYTRVEIAALLNTYSGPTQVYVKPERKTTNVDKLWASFQPAADSARCVDYLYGRGFDQPEIVCRTYDLRWSPRGRWAMRLLIPITNAEGAVVSWSGRAIANHIEPRYSMPPGEQRGLLYAPRQMRAIALVVEGPLDALKIAAATEQSPLSPIALLGLKFDLTTAMNIAERVRICSGLYICLDTQMIAPGYRREGLDTTIPGFGQISNLYHEMANTLAKISRSLYIARLHLPGLKDPGEMPIGDIASWLAPISNEGALWEQKKARRFM